MTVIAGLYLIHAEATGVKKKWRSAVECMKKENRKSKKKSTSDVESSRCRLRYPSKQVRAVIK